MIHEVEISEADKPGRYAVRERHTGLMLIKSARDPEFEAARFLVAEGCDGVLATFKACGAPRMVMGLSWAVRTTTQDPSKGRLRYAKWIPYGGSRDA